MIEQPLPNRAILLARGRVAGVALLLVLVFVLFAYHYVQDESSFNSDDLYCVHFCDDLLHGRGVQGFHLPAAPYVFPDMVLLSACVAVTSNLTAVFMLYGALYYGLLLGALFAVNREVGLPCRESFVVAGLGLAFLLASHFDPAYVTHSLLMFHPGNHMGCLLVGLGATAFVLRALRVGYGPPSAAAFVVVCAAGGFSDQLLIVQFIAPLGSAVLLLALCRQARPRRALVTAALLGVSTLLAMKTRGLFVQMGLVPMRITHLDGGLLTDLPGAINGFAESWCLIARGQPLMWVVLGLHLAAASAVLAVWARRAGRGDSPGAEVGEPALRGPAILLVALVLLLAPLSNAAALVVTGSVTPPAVVRYLYTCWLLPFLTLLVWPRLLPGRLPRLAPCAVVAVVALRIAASPGVLEADRFAPRYTPLQQALDEMVRKHGPLRGFGEYWRARESRYLTREHVPVLPILAWGMPWFHGFNPNSFLSDDPHDLTVPDYHFVIFPTDDAPGPDRQQIRTRYGEPDEIIAVEKNEIWRYERLASRPLELFLRAQLAQRLVRERPFVAPSQPASLGRPRANLSAWTEKGNILFPRGQSVLVRFDRPATGAMVNLGAHFGDEYVLSFRRGGGELGTTRVPAVNWTGAEVAYCPPGMQSRLVPVPPACRPGGFDEVLVTPAGRQEWFVLGHFLVFDEWIPYKPAVRRHEGPHRRYEGEKMSGPDSPEITTVADPSASGGRARQASASFQGCMACGPPLPLAPGSYRVEFALRVEDEPSADVIATLDAAAFGGQQVLASRPLRGADLAPAGRYGRYGFTVEADEELELVEFRVTVHGKTAVTLDCVDVTRLGGATSTARR